MKFIKYNANPKGWKDDDCVIRAIAAGTQQTWEQVFEDLVDIARKKCRMPNSDQVYMKYLKDKGFQEMKQLKHANGTKYYIHEVIEEYPDDILILHCAHHLTVALQGTLIDTWNCSWRVAGKFFRIPASEFDNDEVRNYVEYFIKENRMLERIRL